MNQPLLRDLRENPELVCVWWHSRHGDYWLLMQDWTGSQTGFDGGKGPLLKIRQARTRQMRFCTHWNLAKLLLETQNSIPWHQVQAEDDDWMNISSRHSDTIRPGSRPAYRLQGTSTSKASQFGNPSPSLSFSPSPSSFYALSASSTVALALLGV